MKHAPLLLVTTLAAATATAREIGFNRDVRPIVADACFHCHGPDPASREEGLRFDTKEGFFAARDTGPMVVPGKPEQSPFYQRVIATDPDEIMPPPKAHKDLTQTQKELLRDWILQGAPWEPHWSFLAPVKAPEPAVRTDAAKAGFPVRNAIDSFVFDRLRREGLAPAPEADRRTLARRLSLDLTGLPPDPERVEAFVRDTSPGAYEAHVDALLASPRYGEHRARTWLDAARYGDTHGLHFDNYREMWPYRDWVINAFNRNQPFDQFTIEQIAGDLLPNPTRDQQVATGFHRCNITTNEGGTIPEENLAGYARDRVSTTGWVWLGLTANCAECHDHKFDPVSMKDFYALSAFFRNTTQGALDGNVKDSAPSLRVPAMEDAARSDALPGEIAAARRELDQHRQEALGRFDGWLAAVTPGDLQGEPPVRGRILHLPLDEGAGLEVKDRIEPGRSFRADGPLEWRPGQTGSAPVFGQHFLDLGDLGDFPRTQAFTAAAWIRPDNAAQSGAILSRMDTAAKYRGWDFWQNAGKIGMHVINAWPDNALKVVTKEDVVKPGQWQHVLVTHDGSGKAKGVKVFVDGVEMATAPETATLKPRADIRTRVSLKVGRRTNSEPFSGQVQDVRLFDRALGKSEIYALARQGKLGDALAEVRAPAPASGPGLAAFFGTLPAEGLVVHVPLNEGVGREAADGLDPTRRHAADAAPEWHPGGPLGDAPFFAKGRSFNLGNAGDFEKDAKFSWGVWIRAGDDHDHSAILARMDDQADYRGWDIFKQDRRLAVHIVHKWPSDALLVRTKADVVKPGQWQHAFATYDGSGKAEGVRLFLDGKPVETEITHNSLQGSIRTAVPLRVGQRSTGQPFAGGQAQDARVYARVLFDAEIAALAAARPPEGAVVSIARAKQAREDLRQYFVSVADTASAESQARLTELETEQEDILQRSPFTHVQVERKDGMPTAHILLRGQYDQTGDLVGANTPHALPPMPAGSPTNRLGLAQWLVMKENPLPARVTVNRLWQELFGTGIVRTSDDFGIVGDKPVHPELLDWLAVEFRDTGWDVKRMVKLLVMSSAYRQSAAATPDKLARDPANRLLSRGPRFRMDAEMVRDTALAVSGLLSPRIGGASARPYQPEGVWEAVAMPESNTKRYTHDEGEDLYRRSLYTFWKRSAPPASMDIFNAPSREVSCSRRERTNTPLQALVTLNDPQFIESARHLAGNALKATGSKPDAAVQYMAARALSRPLRSDELDIVLGTLRDMRAHYAGQPADAAALLAVGDAASDPALAPAELAAWTMVANQLLNLDEVLNK